MENVIGLARRLGHFPTRAEMRLERGSVDPSFPDSSVYGKFGSKNDFIGKALDYCRESVDHADVVPILESAYRPSRTQDDQATRSTEDAATYGFVYLVRGHPGEYKIGRTNLVDRRVSEVGATSPVEHKLVHEIKTDDPAGVENYWHKRFAGERLRGEWFRLSAADVRAFKRWRRIY